MWILAAAGRLLGGGWSPAARSAAKIHAFLLFSGGGWVSLGKLNFGAQDWILGGWVVLENQRHSHATTPSPLPKGAAAHGWAREWV
eukprot:COSAG01_NODE_1899_length_8965_cov_3.885969_6_plen_86_part_00